MARTALIVVLVALGLVVLYLLLRGARYTAERMSSPYKYFAFSEFDSPDLPGSGEQKMDRTFIHILDEIRDEVGFPMIINSGYRTPAHNAKVGGKPNSAHLRGYAADIRVFNDAQKRAIAKAAIKYGVKRIGWANNYIHLDVDPSLPQNVVWGYNGNTPPTFSSLA